MNQYGAFRLGQYLIEQLGVLVGHAIGAVDRYRDIRHAESFNLGLLVDTPFLLGAAQIDDGCVTGVCQRLQSCHVRLTTGRHVLQRLPAVTYFLSLCGPRESEKERGCQPAQ